MNRLFCALILLGLFCTMPKLQAQYEGNSPFCHQGGGLLINEISNGPTSGEANMEYIELVVTPDQANPSAPVNLQGWILDDNNVAASGEGNAAGHFVLGDCYQAVPPGAILVLYNPEGRNPDLPADDPTDADGDGVYIIPADNDCVLSCNSNPTTEDSNYCPCSDPELPAPAWQIGLRNSGDLFQVRDACESVVHAISWGSLDLAPDLENSPTYFRINGNSQSGLVIRFTNFVSDDWQDATNYDNPSVNTGQSPGAPNNAANADFLLQLQNGTFTACGGTIFDCRQADAGDLEAPDGITASPIVLCAGEDLDAFLANYDQPDETEPQAPGLNFEHAFLLSTEEGPEYPLLDVSFDGDFDFSNLPEGTYRLWGYSYIQTNGSVTLADFLASGISSIEEIQNYFACGFDSNLDSLDQTGQIVAVEIVDAPTAVTPSEPLQSCTDELTANFDLTTFDPVISGGSSLPVVWYSDAGGTQTIPDPLNYTSASATVFARLENGNCSSDLVPVNLEIGGTFDVNIQVDEAPDCDNPLGAFSLNITDTTGLDINWNIREWNGTTVRTEVAPGTYTVTVTDANGCRDSSSIRLNPGGTAIAEYLTGNPSCTAPDGGSIQLADIVGGLEPYEISINGGVFEPAADWSAAGLTAGNYTLILRDATGCESAQGVVLQLPAGPLLDLGPDLEIEAGESVLISPAIDFPLTDLSWTPQTGIMAEVDGLSIQASQTTTYTFTATDDAGCTSTDQFTVTVIPPDVEEPANPQDPTDVYIPNAFSPNEDGVNDTFTVFSNEEVAMIRSMRIFDRWGNLLFDRSDLAPNDIQQGWRGQVNGRTLAMGVYIYFVELEYTDGTTEIFKGEVSIIR